MANHPHDSKRPESIAVRRALDKDDMEALGLALSPRQRAFCREYIIDFNGSASAIRAGYSIKHSDKQAYLLLHNKGVARYVDHLSMSKEARITSVDPDYVIQKVTEIVTKEGSSDSNKLRGLELLARHLGMFVDRTEITGKDGGAIEMETRKIEEDALAFTNAMKAMRDRVKKDVTLV